MRYYLTTIILLAVATLVEFKSKNVVAEVPRHVARLAHLPPAEREVEHEQFNAQHIIRHANILEAVALLFAVMGVAAWIASRRKKEKGTQVIPIVLACTFMMMILVQV